MKGGLKGRNDGVRSFVTTYIQTLQNGNEGMSREMIQTCICSYFYMKANHEGGPIPASRCFSGKITNRPDERLVIFRLQD